MVYDYYYFARIHGISDIGDVKVESDVEVWRRESVISGDEKSILVAQCSKKTYEELKNGRDEKFCVSYDEFFYFTDDCRGFGDFDIIRTKSGGFYFGCIHKIDVGCSLKYLRGATKEVLSFEQVSNMILEMELVFGIE